MTRIPITPHLFYEIPSHSMAPWATRQRQPHEVIIYEYRKSISLKGDYINAQKFRGAMFWELSGRLTDGTGLLPVIKNKVKP